MAKNSIPHYSHNSCIHGFCGIPRPGADISIPDAIIAVVDATN